MDPRDRALPRPFIQMCPRSGYKEVKLPRRGGIFLLNPPPPVFGGHQSSQASGEGEVGCFCALPHRLAFWIHPARSSDDNFVFIKMFGVYIKYTIQYCK